MQDFLGIFLMLGFFILCNKFIAYINFKAGFLQGMYACLRRQGRSEESAKSYIQEYLKHLQEEAEKKKGA